MGEHRRTRSSVTGRYYCIYDGEDWPCPALSDDATNGVTDSIQTRPLGPK